MNQRFQAILDFITQSPVLSDEGKAALSKTLKEADEELEVTAFKLQRTEKVKRTTAILLEETIEELEQKRKAVELQNRELEIESSLERVRTVAMSMNQPDDMLDVCRIISEQLETLGTKEIRNVQTAIFYKDKGTYINYEYYRLHNKSLITEVDYRHDTMTSAFASRMMKGSGEFFTESLTEKALKDWFEFQKTTPQFADPHLTEASSLNYYWFSLGSIALGISTYAPLPGEEISLFKRFRNVFELCYRRFLDIEKAAAQAKEARIEASLERMRAAAMSMRKSEELITVCEAMYKELTVLGFTNIRNAQIAIKNDAGQSYLVCEYSDHNIAVMQEAPYNSSPIVKVLYDELEKSKDALYQKEFAGKEFDDWRAWRKNIGASIDSRIEQAHSMCFYLYSFGKGHLGISTFNAITSEQLETLKRFKNVFELSYRRYIDVANAEAQAREAQIELALERVRAGTMAMQKSEELAETSLVLFQQFKDLGEPSEQISIGIFNEDENIMELYSTLYGSQWKDAARVDLNEPVVMKKIHAAWREQKKSLVIDLAGKDLREYNAFRKKLSNLEYREDRWVIHIAFFSKGVLTFSTTEPQPQDTIQLLERFTQVFEQTYTRFLDLQKAEAQAREAQIEAALERVRARAMAMQKSDELAEVAGLLFKQVNDLGIKPWTTGFNVWSDDNNSYTDYITNPQGGFIEPYTIDATQYSVFVAVSDAKKRGEEFFVQYEEGELLKETYRQLSKFGEKQFKAILESGFQFPLKQFDHFVFGSKVSLLFITYEPVPEAHDIFKRFGKVFEQTYTRFLDLQKAEAQARESQIELGLERVRARAMAMQNSDELSELVAVVFEELTKLNLILYRCIIWIFNAETSAARVWMANSEDKKNAESYFIKRINHPYYDAILKGWKERNPKWVYDLHGEDKKSIDKLLLGETELASLPEAVKTGILSSEHTIISGSFNNFGLIEASGPVKQSDEQLEILSRFGKVFDLTYTRFNDLKQAEAQARESQIEASLERVRSKAMAMQKSEDLAVAVATVFEELDKLNLGMLRCGIGILDKVKCSADVWTTTKTEHGTAVQVAGDEPMNIHPLLQGAFDAWLQQKEDYSYVLRGEDLNGFYKALIDTNFKLPVSQSIISGAMGLEQYYYVTTFQSGGLYAFRETAFPEEAKMVMKRFADVFNFTYTRFSDLKQAEAQAREAKIETALERVRSRTLAMQKSDELAETAAVVFRQLINLGIEPNRLYIGIITDDSGNIEFWITDEDGTRVSTQFTGNISRSPIMAKMYDGWKEQKKSITIDIHGKELQNYFHYLGEELKVPFKLGLSQKRRLQSIAYFSKGFIGIASPDEQPEDTTFLLERFAGVFNLTFTRFNDLKIAEAHAVQAELDLVQLQTEKKRAEDALTELRATQNQLIQSEKMASLGELTAGIAHEIQNPLNFVNNFSEINTELIDELQEEVGKGNLDEIKAIANDIKENERKINHHGKRADAIVKGMLQHSRSSSASKEPTDINALADEYVRLCYHGIRAKDKSFNATIKTDFDSSLEKINIIPQDIGRVILNLLTNAFYAVNEKKKNPQPLKGGEEYEPTVTVSTKSVKPSSGGLGVVIIVSDNGNGIQQKVLDKIFQPFFTTKPTGQGTGLGLSLSYDIIKAHGGEIKVRTKEDEGSEFIITII